MKRIAAAIFALIATSLFIQAAPVTKMDAASAAATFVALRYPAATPSKGTLLSTVPGIVAAAAGSAPLSVAAVEPLDINGSHIGYVASLKPEGYVLMRADDLCPPVKFYSEHGSFAALAPGMLAVLTYELEAELAGLRDIVAAGTAVDKQFSEQWMALKKGDMAAVSVNAFKAQADTLAGPILTTTWNQNSPYNYYCPTASGGPGSRAYAGCVACAMSQVMRYYQAPTVLVGSHSYTDNSGSCKGTHSTSDAGTGPYSWANMPLSISGSSSAAQQQAVGQLMYHAGVTVDMDYEATGSGAYSDDVPNALRTYFGYSCGNLLYKDGSYTDAQWYNMINTEITASRPVFYAMQNPASEGHAVVCDGTRNGTELHINMGWSGSCDGWYSITNIYGFDRLHRCITGIVANAGGGGGTGGTGVFTVTTLKGKVYWNQSCVPAGVLPLGAGDFVLKGSTPTTLTSLSPLNGVNLGPTLTLNAGTKTNVLFEGNFFYCMDKKCQKAVFSGINHNYKMLWTFIVQIKKNRLFVTGIGKHLFYQDCAFDVGDFSCDWTGKPIWVQLNISGGGIEVHALGTKSIMYKTKQGSATTIK